jgi:hypothetical protein
MYINDFTYLNLQTVQTDPPKSSYRLGVIKISICIHVCSMYIYLYVCIYIHIYTNMYVSIIFTNSYISPVPIDPPKSFYRLHIIKMDWFIFA